MGMFLQLFRLNKMLSKLLGSNRALLYRSIRRMATDVNEMPFTFASPGGVFYNAASNVKQVDVPSFSGSLGILPSHVPVLAVLKPGVVCVHESQGDIKKYFVSSGSVSVNIDKSVQILAEEACPLDDLDAQSAKQALSTAQAQLSAAVGEKEQAEAQIRVDVNSAIISACEHGV